MSGHRSKSNVIERSAPKIQRQDRMPEAHANEVRGSEGYDVLADIIAKGGNTPNAGAHAATLNRATASRPARASHSLLQLQRQYGNRYVQRVLELARQGEGDAEVAPEVERSIKQARGGGQALDSGVREQMEPVFGSDFSGVRVHTDRESDALNQSLNARAFTTGQDIFFRDGAYNPGSSGGRELIAHELTHVAQQNGGQVQTKLTVTQPEDRFEREADQVARAIMQQEQRAIQPAATTGTVRRQKEEEAENTVQTQPEPKEEPVQPSPIDASVQCQDEREEDEQPPQASFVQRQEVEDEEAPIQTQPEPDTGSRMPLPVASALGPSALPAGDGAPGTHVQMQAGKPAAKGESDVFPGVVDLQGKSTYAEMPAGVSKWLEDRRRKRGKVNVRFGPKTTPAPIRMQKTRKGLRLLEREAIPLNHPLFTGMGEASAELQPSLILAKGYTVAGYLGLRAGKRLPSRDTLSGQLRRAPNLIGLLGLQVPSAPNLTNKIEGGKLILDGQVSFRLGKAFRDASISVQADEEQVTKLEGSVDAEIQGLGSASLKMTRKEDGVVRGEGTADLELTDNFSGKVNVFWTGEVVAGDGTVEYSGEKLSGQVTLHVVERSKATQLEEQRKAPPEGENAKPAKKSKKKRAKPNDYVVFGEGNLTFAFTDWLNGTAQVIVDPKGEVTIIGEIKPQKEFNLFDPPQKDYNKDLVNPPEVRAKYGLPVVGNIFIFGSIELDAFAKLGPAKLYDIAVEGEYSTDPKKRQSFQIRGTLNISAAAGLRLRAEAGAGLEIISHDIKAGAGVNGIAAIRGYAEARPIVGYREKGAEGEDKKGEFFIRGDMEIAAQPFLQLSGDLFVELDSPWWSPAPDKKWTWELGDKTWPIGGSFGIGASVDYVFGSGKAPAVDFKSVDFSANKFLTDLYSDKARASGRKAAEKAGEWKEKNSRAAEPPKGEQKGNADPGKAPAKPAAQPTVKAGGPKGPKKPADPNAKTAEGKTVKELKSEARKRGKKPEGKEPKTGSAKAEPSAKDPAKKTHDAELQAGLAALAQVTKRYAEAGATKEELEKAVKSVRRKFKVFKSIEIVDGGRTWDYRYVASEGKQQGPHKSKEGARHPDGSSENPYWIKWHKRPARNYPPIKVRRAPDADFTRVGPIEQKSITVAVPNEEMGSRLTRLKVRLGNLERELRKREDLQGKRDRNILEDAEKRLAAAEEELARLRQLSLAEKRGKVKPQVKIVKSLKAEVKEIRSALNKIAHIPELTSEIQTVRDEIQDIDAKIVEGGLTVEQSKTIGIAPENQIKKGMKLKRETTERGGTGEDFRKFMSQAGHGLSEHRKHPDHVKELAFKGPDNFSNLWPLPGNENIVPTQKVNPETGKEVNVGFKGAGEKEKGKDVNTFGEFRGKWFIIKGFKI
jgi:hypothetical protein